VIGAEAWFRVLLISIPRNETGVIRHFQDDAKKKFAEQETAALNAAPKRDWQQTR
jgi:hypothetical protein